MEISRTWTLFTGVATRSPLSSEANRLQKYNITLNAFLLSDMTQSQLQPYKLSWKSASDAKPSWMTMLVCQPPVQRLTIEFIFLDTALPSYEFPTERHETIRALVDPIGIVLGDYLNATHDSTWWEEMKLSRKEADRDVRAWLLPSAPQEGSGKNDGPCVLNSELCVLLREPPPTPVFVEKPLKPAIPRLLPIYEVFRNILFNVQH
jgi:hypothetical protein